MVLRPGRALIALSVAAALPMVAAEGTRTIGFGPIQTSTAGAGLASPQDSSWLALNPAALVELGSRIDADASLFRPSDSETPAGPLGNSSAGKQDDTQNIYVPDLSAAQPLAGGVLGLGLFTVAGLAIDYPASRSLFGQAGGYDHRAAARFVSAELGYGREVLDGWAVGVTLIGDYEDFQSDSLTRFGTETAGGYALDHAWGAGFALGVHKRWQEISVGAAYTSRQWMKRLTRYRDLLDSSFDQPQLLQLGLAWRALPWLEALVDYRFINWHEVKVYGDSSTGFGWRNQQVFMAGGSVTAGPGLTVRAGYSYGRSPIDQSEVFTNALSPLISEAHACIGLSWDVTPRYRYDLTYMHAFRNSLSDNGADAGGAGTGTRISLAVDEVSMGIGCAF